MASKAAACSDRLVEVFHELRLSETPCNIYNDEMDTEYDNITVLKIENSVTCNYKIRSKK